MSDKTTRNPLLIIRGYIDYLTTSLKQCKQANDDPLHVAIIDMKISMLRTIETDMEIEYFELGEKTTLHELRKGAVFATEDGTYAVKSEYRYSNENQQWQCILLASGEYAHFKDGNKTVVYEVIMPRNREG